MARIKPKCIAASNMQVLAVMEVYPCRWKQACNFGDRGHHPGALPELPSCEIMCLDHSNKFTISHCQSGTVSVP